MHKQLPQPKKSLKSFILEDDAKITDKTAAKITITTAFLAINIAAASQDANAKGHSNHSNHSNNLNVDSDYGTGYHIGNNPTETDINSIQDKAVLSAHGNHYNHSDAGGGQGGLLGIVIGFAISFMLPIAAPSLFGAAAAAGGAAGTATTILGGVMSTAGISSIGTVAISNAIVSTGISEIITGGAISDAITNIDTGTPHTVPGPIINALREEEQS